MCLNPGFSTEYSGWLVRFHNLSIYLFQSQFSSSVVAWSTCLLLCLPSSSELSLKGHIRIDGLLADYCDASFTKNSDLFNSNLNVLQLIMYFDEVEVCDRAHDKKLKCQDKFPDKCIVAQTKIKIYNNIMQQAIHVRQNLSGNLS